MKIYLGKVFYWSHARIGGQDWEPPHGDHWATTCCVHPFSDACVYIFILLFTTCWLISANLYIISLKYIFSQLHDILCKDSVNIMRFCVLNKCTKEKYSIKYIPYINNISYTLPKVTLKNSWFNTLYVQGRVFMFFVGFIFGEGGI